MYDESSYQGAVSEEQVFFIAMLSLQGLSTKIFSDTTTDWQVNARNFEMGVKQFESSAIRHLDKEYFRKLRILITKGREKITRYRDQNPQISLTNMGKEYELMVSLEVARKRFALIIKALDRHDVFSQPSQSAVQTDYVSLPGQKPKNTGDGIGGVIEDGAIQK